MRLSSSRGLSLSLVSVRVPFLAAVLLPFALAAAVSCGVSGGVPAGEPPFRHVPAVTMAPATLSVPAAGVLGPRLVMREPLAPALTASGVNPGPRRLPTPTGLPPSPSPAAGGAAVFPLPAGAVGATPPSVRVLPPAVTPPFMPAVPEVVTPSPSGVGPGGLYSPGLEPPMLYLTSFRHSVEYRLELDGAGLPPVFALRVTGEFVAPDLLSCRHEAAFLGITLGFPRVVVSGDSAWVDLGEGWRPALLSEPEVAEALGLCAGHLSFWQAVPLSVPVGGGGSETVRNGVSAVRHHFTDGLDPVDYFPDYASQVDELSASLWLAALGGWPVSLLVQGSAPVAVGDWGLFSGEYEGPGGEASGGAPLPAEAVVLRLLLAVDITDPDDPAVAVIPPDVGPGRVRVCGVKRATAGGRKAPKN